MSQHSYKYKEVKVVAGWDKSLGYLFLVVENGTSNIPVYDNLSDPNATNAQDTEHYKKILMTLSIPVPEGFWLALENDRDSDKGSSFRCWELNL